MRYICFLAAAIAATAGAVTGTDRTLLFWLITALAVTALPVYRKICPEGFWLYLVWLAFVEWINFEVMLNGDIYRLLGGVL